MEFVRRLSLVVLTVSFLGASDLSEDPVMKARTLRAQAQGINEADLPPVPRSVMEPPPLPPPEVHRKDAGGGRVAKARGKVKHAAKGARHAAVASHHAAPGGKPARKAGKSAARNGKKGKA
jgi:hypothetical protein